MNISIVIPVYNEENRINKTLDKIRHFLSNHRLSDEVIIVDDGSTDATYTIVSDYAKRNKNVRIIRNDQNKGKGFSVKRGVLAATGDTILFTDADLSTPIEELKIFLPHLNKHDIVIASRGLERSRIIVKQPKFRQLLGKIFPFIVQLLLRLNIKDTQCGFKLFRAAAAKEIFSRQRLDGFAFDAEVLFVAKKLGYRIKEIPVEWANVGGSKVKVIRDPFLMLFDVFRVWTYGILGAYNQTKRTRPE